MAEIDSQKWLEKVSANTTDKEKELLKRAIDVLVYNIPDDPKTPWYPKKCVVPANGIPWLYGIWNWDTAFHAIGLSHFDLEIARENIVTFLSFQNEDGMLPDVVRGTNGEIVRNYSKPPVMPWAAQRIHELQKDEDFLNFVYPRFVRYEKFLSENRCDKGMFHYDVTMPKDRVLSDEEYHTWAGYDTGWDNSVRWDKGIVNLYPIDLNCYMVMYYRAMSYFAKELNLNGDVLMWNSKEKDLIDRINSTLWDDENKAYVDADRFTGEKSKVLTPASFMPLFIEIASKERADYMNILASNKHKFFPGMPSVAYDDPEYSLGYWRGVTWLNIAYFAAKGLKNYGYKVADEIKDYILDMCYDVKTGIHENYDSVNRTGANVDHFSWSAVFIIEFIKNF